MPTLPAETLRSVMRAIFEGVGTPAETACLVGDALVDANLAGHDSHGVIRVLQYIEVMRSGALEPTAEPEVVSRFGATATVDGRWGWGQPAMWLATETAIAAAREFGLGATVVRNSYHIGRVAPYVEAIARAGMIGLAMANAGPAVAPYGGRSRVMGTNPIAWAAPRGNGKAPICLDVATAAIAEGKVRVARAKGESVPPGMIVRRDGLPTTIPDEFYEGGALLSFGLHKGSGLSLLAQVAGRGLAGMLPAMLATHRGANGPFVLAINIEAFTPLDQFIVEIEAQCDAVVASAPAEGFTRVQLPGEPELEQRARREVEGIPVPEPVWRDLLALAEELGVREPAWSA